MGNPLIPPRTDTGSVTGTSSQSAASATPTPPCNSIRIEPRSYENEVGTAKVQPPPTATPASARTPGLSFMIRSFPAYTLAMIVATVLTVIPFTSFVGVPLILGLMGLGLGGLGVGVYEARDRNPPHGANRA